MTYSWRLSSGVELGENDRRTQKGAKYTWSPLAAKLEGTVPQVPWGGCPDVRTVLAVNGRAYSKRVPRTNCALRIKKCAPRISSGIYFLSTS